MVNLPGLSYATIVTRFREYSLIQQAAIAAVIVLLMYIPYSYFLLRLSITESVVMAVYSALLFVAVYYLTSVFILRKRRYQTAQSPGPKKGLRNK